MRILAGLALFGLLSAPALAAPVRVKGYVKPSTGRYVAPAVRTAPDRTRINNYSTKGNANPYTGRAGTKPVLPPPAPGR